ncbi:hypothetical protein ABZ912_51790 [Nonomuraea angiospora]|uniref:hypothetical protein n=1 Tax=Nonomuraea angiospora TaxID=46172 RepID=UPI0033F3CC04
MIILDPTENNLISQVEKLLAPAAVVGWRRLEPWAVARAELSGPPGSVIVKWMRPRGPGPDRSESWRLRSEVAALGFLSDDLGVRLAPRVVAADPAAGLVVLEDLAPRVALDGLLRADGTAAHGERLEAFARVRGELNAVTAGRAEAYYARRAALGAVDRVAGCAGRFAGFREEGRLQVAALGVEVAGGAERELAVVLEELEDPGPFLALSNGDPEANNVLVRAAGAPDARVIDFEFAGFTHALHDAVCLYVPGPAWLSVDAGMGAAYRRALAVGVPEAQDDRRFGFGLAAACFSYALLRLQRLSQVDGRAAGDDSRVQLVATVEAAARVAEWFGVLPGLAGWAWRVGEALRRRWPDADVDVAALPAFTARRR